MVADAVLTYILAFTTLSVNVLRVLAMSEEALKPPSPAYETVVMLEASVQFHK